MSKIQQTTAVCRHTVFLTAMAFVFSTTAGCMSSLLNFSEPSTFGERFSQLMNNDKRREKKDDDNSFDASTKIETPLLRDYISVTGNNVVELRGVGLVMGLDGSGGDPPPSHLRKELMDEMARRKIPNASAILASRDTALVIVTAFLPPMVREDQRFDVRVILPPNSEATSLKGGTLLETRLSEEQFVRGRGNLKGHQYAVAQGAILTALGDGGRANAAMLRRGTVPGGAVSKTERNLEVILRNEHRGLKTSQRVERAIANRLHHYNRFGQRIPMATAKTDLMVELKVHPTYRSNFPRYQQMIRSIAYRESDIARRLRMEKLEEQIMNPATAGSAALQLEAIGRDGIPFLKAALESPNTEVRFHAAQALAYMEDSSGVEVLKQAAAQEPAFRVYALAALSVINDADTVVALRELMSDENLETRYGAVRALKENNGNDPSLGTNVFSNRFILHAVRSQGPPAVHVVRYRAPEVVVFGAEQELRLPAVLNVGSRIRIIGSAGQNTVTVTRYRLNAEPDRKVVSTNLVEILRTVAEMGARYPDVVQMLLEADSQSNLEGELGIDRLPQAGRAFLRRTEDGASPEREAKLGTPSLTPGLFDRIDESEQSSPEEDSSVLARMFAMRSAAEAEESDSESADGTDDQSSFSGDEQTEYEIEKVDASLIEQLDPSDESDADDQNDEFVPERSEFREPLGSKLRRVFLSPFQKKED